MFKKILTGTAIYGAAPHIPKLASFFTLPLITQELTDYDYGIAGLVAAYSLIFQSFVVLGLNLSFTNSFFKHPRLYQVVWRHLYGTLLYWTVIYVALQYLVLHLLLPGDLLHRQLVIVLVISSPLFFGPAAFLCSLKYQYEKNPAPVAIRSLLSGFAIIFFNVYFIVFLKLGFLGWFMSDFLVNSARHFSYWLVLRFRHGIYPVYAVRFRYAWAHVKSSLSLIPHNYSSFLLKSSDKIVMDKIGVPATQIGQYSMAANFGNYFATFGLAYSMAVNPYIYTALASSNKRECVRILYFSVALFLVLTSGFCLFSREIFQLMIRNETLAQTYPLAIVLIMSVNYRPLYTWFSSFLMFHNMPGRLASIAFSLGVANVLLNIIFVPMYGFEVAAVTTYLCYMLYGFIGFTGKKLRETFGVRVLMVSAATLVLSTVATGVIVFWAVDLSFPVKIAILAVLVVPVVIFGKDRLKRLFSV